MYQGLLFDLDGTLVDSLSDLAVSVNEVLAGAGYPTHPEAALRFMVGNGMRVLVRRALPRDLGDELELARIQTLVESVYDRHCLDLTRPYPGIETLLVELRRRSFRLGVLSNKPEAFTRKVVDALFPAGSFDLVRGQGPGFPPKPDPASALEAARSWSLGPREVVFLGDSDVDIATGRAAGMLSLGALWGFRGREELEAAGAAGLLERPEELLNWI
jgi:phosphoglycolate phosphatase